MGASLFLGNLEDFLVLDAFGALLAIYALYVELRKERNPSYVAMCDFNEQMSCSRVLTSE